VIHHLPVQLLHPADDVVLQPEIGQELPQQVELHSVVARVGSDLAGVGNLRRRHEPLHLVADVPDLVVLVAGSHVDGAVVDDVSRCLGKRDECPGDVAAVDERPPGGAVRLDPDLAVSAGRAQQVVHDEVDAKHGRVAVRRRIAEVGRAERRVGQLRQLDLGLDLGLGVGREWIQGIALVQVELLAFPVNRATPCEEESGNPRLLGNPRESDGGIAVHVERELRVHRTHRVVREGCQVHDAVASIEVGYLDQPRVLHNLPCGSDDRLPGAAVEESKVAADDRVPLLHQNVDEVAADVTAMTGDEDFHVIGILF
jgi:hypothetical protein